MAPLGVVVDEASPDQVVVAGHEGVEDVEPVGDRAEPDEGPVAEDCCRDRAEVAGGDAVNREGEGPRRQQVGGDECQVFSEVSVGDAGERAGEHLEAEVAGKAEPANPSADAQQAGRSLGRRDAEG